MIKKQGTILIVDDNRNILTTVRMLLEPVFANIITIANPNSIPAKLREEHPDVVLLDMNFSSGINSGNEGLFWLREIKSLSPKTEVVLFTAYADIQLAVTGIKEGAADFIVKPFDNGKMISTLTEARDKNKAADKAAGKLGGKNAQGMMYWGESEVMTDLRHVVEKVAATDANILITGENGTGKEVLANEIHRLSTRSGKKMLPVDMGAISETLFESELFGHVKGAFTDAKVDKPGKFELADGSTIFLDEIGNLSYSLQAKLLTALQRRSIVRVGGSTQIPVDVWSAPPTAICSRWLTTANSERICSIVSTLSTWNCQPSDRERLTSCRSPTYFFVSMTTYTTRPTFASRMRQRRSLPVCLGMAISESCSTPSRKP